MPLLNTAKAIYAGSTPAKAVYLGGKKIWPIALEPVVVTVYATSGTNPENFQADRPVSYAFGPPDGTTARTTNTNTSAKGTWLSFADLQAIPGSAVIDKVEYGVKHQQSSSQGYMRMLARRDGVDLDQKTINSPSASSSLTTTEWASTSTDWTPANLKNTTLFWGNASDGGTAKPAILDAAWMRVTYRA